MIGASNMLLYTLTQSLIFFFLIQKKITKKNVTKKVTVTDLAFSKKIDGQIQPLGKAFENNFGSWGGQEIKQANLQKFKCQGRRDVDLSFELIDK